MNSELQAGESGMGRDAGGLEGAGSAGGAGAAGGSGADLREAAGADAEAQESPVNYEEAAVLELEIDGTDYRLDVGRAGTALCISTRPSGSWSWYFRGEARWQNGVMRCKAFDRSVLSQLSTALAEAAANSQS